MGIGSFLKPNKAKTVFIVLFAIGLSMVFLSLEILFIESDKYFKEVEELIGESIGSDYLFESAMTGVWETYAVNLLIAIIVLYIFSCFIEKFLFGLLDRRPWPIKIAVPILLIIGIFTSTLSYFALSISPVPTIIPSILNGAAVVLMWSGVFLFQRILAKEYEKRKSFAQA